MDPVVREEGPILMSDLLIKPPAWMEYCELPTRSGESRFLSVACCGGTAPE